jgi:hypothetical protein
MKVLITRRHNNGGTVLDPSTGNFTPTTGKLGTARNNDATATLLPERQGIDQRRFQYHCG